MKLDALLQILEGLQYLHSNSITHSDLKSANVLISEREGTDGYLFKLTDFGGSHAEISSKIMSNISSISNKKKTGKTSFEAPEVFMGNVKTCASDVYSFGMVMYELLYHCFSHPWESVFKQQVSPITLASLIIGAVNIGQRPAIKEPSPYTERMELCWKQNTADRLQLLPSL